LKKTSQVDTPGTEIVAGAGLKPDREFTLTDAEKQKGRADCSERPLRI
jgi:hypothetical protein